MKHYAVMYVAGNRLVDLNKGGFGAHGYTYKETSLKPFKALHSIHHLTDKGYTLPNDENRYELVKPLEVFNIAMPLTEELSPTTAELKAITYTLDYLQRTDVTDIVIYTSNKYINAGVSEHLDRWSKTNWLKKDGSPVTDHTLWKLLSELLSIYKVNNKTVNVLLTQDSTDDAGGLIAITLALIASNSDSLSYNYKKTNVQSFDQYKKETFTPNDLLIFKRLYFNTNDSVVLRRYHCANPPKEDGHFGKRTNEAVYAVLDLEKRDPVVDVVIKKHNALSRDYFATATLNLEKVFNKKIYWFLNVYKDNCLYHKNRNSNELLFVDGTVLSEDINSPGVLFKALDVFNTLDQVYVEYLTSPEYTSVDLTSIFYSNNGLKEHYKTGVIEAVIDSPFVKDKPLRLTLGKNLPTRNVLKRIEKLNPIVKLIFWKTSSFSYRYVCTIEADNIKSLWSNYHTSLFLLAGSLQ